MIDVDLGPVVMFIFVIFFIIPSVLGLLIGVFLGLHIFKKQEGHKSIRIAKIAFLAISLAIFFPTIFINAEKIFSRYEDNRFYEDTQKFEKELADSYKIENVSIERGNYTIAINVPQSGDYFIDVKAYQGGICRSIFTPMYNLGTPNITLNAGLNVISGEVNNKIFSDQTFCSSLYTKNASTLPDDISVGMIDLNKPIDIAMEIKNTSVEHVLLNDKRNISVSNSKSIVKDGSLIIYSPRLSKSGQCPIYNHINYSTCIADKMLSVN